MVGWVNKSDSLVTHTAASVHPSAQLHHLCVNCWDGTAEGRGREREREREREGEGGRERGGELMFVLRP